MNNNVFIKDEAVSALIKSMRFSDFAEAAYWFEVLVENEINEVYLAKRLCIFASEDCFDSDLILLANSVFQMYLMKNGNGNMLWQVLYRCCKAKKFWEVVDGQEYEITINKAIEKYKKEGILDTPKWAIDKHTKKYYELVEKGQEHKTDIRFSGDDFGRLHMVKMFKKYGRISCEIDDSEISREVENELNY